MTDLLDSLVMAVGPYARNGMIGPRLWQISSIFMCVIYLAVITALPVIVGITFTALYIAFMFVDAQNNINT